jgi:5-methylcytosine-specific restriction endonuclease McrA
MKDLFPSSTTDRTCSLCGRTPATDAYLERHHLVPRCKNGRRTITVCIDCGDQLHKLFSLEQMCHTYHTLEAIRADERVGRWVRWIRKQHHFGVCMKTKKRR